MAGNPSIDALRRAATELRAQAATLEAIALKLEQGDSDVDLRVDRQSRSGAPTDS